MTKFSAVLIFIFSAIILTVANAAGEEHISLRGKRDDVTDYGGCYGKPWHDCESDGDCKLCDSSQFYVGWCAPKGRCHQRGCYSKSYYDCMSDRDCTLCDSNPWFPGWCAPSGGCRGKEVADKAEAEA